MIWHLPNQVTVKNFSELAFLKYYTTNNFLSRFGGTMQMLYKKHAPLVHAGNGKLTLLLFLKSNMISITSFGWF